ncbi:tetratricopeptide repeat protein [Lysobacter solisilvae (ex Woo and Kim 2020)]|uniref:Tetratricopeptide repeat protein n=1 Tax=Agrilutibacter terrestris TaxID=2865112 RepID=A0A7H0FX04_9GAMM|nr:tetratricopeptide repeat protein [Lysobacter terrestris]QNP40570.1 tetratricopeptide repeat protein [Lysobacter terrestris]
MYALFLAAALSLASPGGDVTTTPTALPPPAAVLALPPGLRQRLHAEVLSTPASEAQRLEQLLHFMLDADALGITYDEGATYSVGETWVQHRANCLSFTLLFLALAREAGLQAQPQEIRNTLSWRQEAGTIYRNNHVNVRVRINGRQLAIDTSGDTLIAVDRPVVISERRLLAHYYNNLAMQELERQNPAGGLQLMAMALDEDPTYAALWSNAGVLHVRMGDLDGAERAYQRALVLDPEEDGALFNMIGLSMRRGDAKRENDFRRRLARVQQRDPLHQFMLAIDAERNGAYGEAIVHYRQAIRLQPDEHRFHSALARAYLKDGDPRRAGKALKRAQALSDGAVRAAYRAQLQDLQQSSN